MEKELGSQLQEPFIILGFSELDKKVDIYASPASLYKDFNKAQILSPSATFIGAVITGVMFARSFDEWSEIMSSYGGTILPILAERAKGKDVVEKYSVALFNGYSDIAEQVAASKGKSLSSAAGSGSQTFIDIIRLIFYGVIALAFYKYFRGKFLAKKRDDE